MSDEFITQRPAIAYLHAIDYAILVLNEDKGSLLKRALISDLDQLRRIILGAPYLIDTSQARAKAVFNTGAAYPGRPILEVLDAPPPPAKKGHEG